MQPIELSAVHVHHGLSPHADDWAAFCAAACRERGVPLTVSRVVVARRGGESLEAAARAARYAAFAALDVDGVALAHHADDQAETLLLQLMRGAGPHGIAAMARGTPAPRPGRRCCGRCWRCGAARSTRMSARTAWRTSTTIPTPTSRSPQPAARRHRAAAGGGVPRLPRTLVRAAAHQAEAAQLLDDLAALDARDAIDAPAPRRPMATSWTGGRWQRSRRARARNLLRWFLRRQGLRAPSAARLAAMLQQLVRRATDARVAVAHDGATVGVHRGWIAIHRPPAAGATAEWRGEPALVLPHGTLLFSPVAGGAGIAATALDGPPLVARAARGGERLRLAADRPRRALTDLWREAGVPPWAARRGRCCSAATNWPPSRAWASRRRSSPAAAPRLRGDWRPAAGDRKA